MYFFIYCILLIYVPISGDNLFCPASSIIDTSMDGTFAYPLDIFDHEQFESSKTSQYQDVIYNCSSSDMDRLSHIHKCSTRTQCPLTEEHIKVAKSRMLNWSTSHSFCEIRRKLRDPTETVRVVILGGSVTHGSATKGFILFMHS